MEEWRNGGMEEWRNGEWRMENGKWKMENGKCGGHARCSCFSVQSASSLRTGSGWSRNGKIARAAS